MAWIYDNYDMMHAGKNNLPVVTGKPISIGGSPGRNEASRPRRLGRRARGPVAFVSL